jgi:hypothetical protein
MMKTVGEDRSLGVSLKHATVVPAARILVIEDNGSDVFLLERALNKQDLRFELIHLLDGGQALAFIRRQGAYADAAIPNLILVDCVEFFPVPARRGTAKAARSFPIHHQAVRAGSIHGHRQNPQGCLGSV